MVPIARRVLFAAKVKFLLTVLGVGTVLMLILFLVAIFEGVKEGSTGYIVNSPAEIWICQKNSTNLLRSSSFIYSSKCQEIEKLRNIKNVILKQIDVLKKRQNRLKKLLYKNHQKNHQQNH